MLYKVTDEAKIWLKPKKRHARHSQVKMKKKNQGFLEDCIKEIPQLNDCLICFFFFWDQCFGFYAIEKVLKKFIPTGGVFNIQRAWTLKRSIVTLRWIVNNYTFFCRSCANEMLEMLDQYQYLGNCPPTPPLTQH